MPRDVAIELGQREHKLELVIGNLLRFGVFLSALVVLAGGVPYLLRHGGDRPAYHTFTGAPAEFRSVHGIVASAAHGDARGIVQLGLLLLVATPIARVVLAGVGFAWERDWGYVAVSLIVLGVLLYSLLRSP